jgi:RNAse (barnase) inhibitor barstar
MAKSDVSTVDKLETEVVFDSDTVGNTDGEAINKAMNMAIANATTVDDILSANASAVEKLKPLWDAGVSWVREPVTILSVSFNESSEEYADGGWGFYAVMEVEDNTGLVHTLSCGAKTVVLKLYQLQKHSTFPMTTKVEFTGSRTKGGFTAFDIVKA